ncbi:MAG: SRPBCC domain-containing protein [Elusimicrobia bacterium]|nr:SRPBCC domain-containing protein [Elusimicrobiota bacterium]
MPSPRRTRDIRLSVLVKAQPSEVYRALTSARELCVWWLDRAETDARNMGRWRMEWGVAARAGRREAAGYFVDLEPARKVALLEEDRTLPKGLPPLATFFIEKRGRASELTLVQAGFSASARGTELRGSVRTHWEDCLAKLKVYLETGRARKGETLDLKVRVPARRKKAAPSRRK